MEEGRLFTHDLAAHLATLDELKERYPGLPRRGIAEVYLLRTRGKVSRYELGAWAWALHRLTGLGLVAYLAAHVILLLTVTNQDELEASIRAHSPYYEIVMVLAIGAIVFHSLNGLRLALGDAGILPMRGQHKVAIWIAGVLAVAAMATTAVRVLG